MVLNRNRLDKLYIQWNKPQYISPDPLETVLPYKQIADREVVAMIASALSYGRVNALLVPLRKLLGIMGKSPADYIQSYSEKQLAGKFENIVYRFAGPDELAALAYGIACVSREHGSLKNSFFPAYQETVSKIQTSENANPVISGLTSMTNAIRSHSKGEPGHLLPQVHRGSSCKRHFLFLRWMIRSDSVDPGGWGQSRDGVNQAYLVQPMDVWMHRIALRAGWTKRKSCDLKTALEVTSALCNINPEDPVKYDFSLSRFGIRSELTLDDLFR